MKIINIITVISCIQFGSMSYGQEVAQNEALKLAGILNNTMSENIQLTLEKDKAILEWDGLSKTLDLRDKSEIEKDGIPKEDITIRLNDSGRYTGPIFWIYNFDLVASSKTSFRTNKFGQLFFKLKFQEQDTIYLKSHLNEYSSHHRTSDSHKHVVQWSGDKYISILLQPENVANTIQFKARGITISGKFQRENQKPIDKNYSKKLKDIFKREFKKLFDDVLLTLNALEDGVTVSSIKRQ